MDELEMFQARLNVATLEDFKWLIDFIPKIQNSKNFGRMTGGHEIEKNILIGHYVVPSNVVSDFNNSCYEMDMVIPFDWMGWKEGKD